METIPQELIENALALTGKKMEDMCIYSDFWEDFSKEYFCYYLLSTEFIEKYIPIIIEEVYLWEYNSDFDADPETVSCEYFWTAICEYQKGNSQPLIDLLSKI